MAEMEDLVKRLEPDLRFLLEQEGLNKDVMARVSHSGYKTVRLFSLIGTTRDTTKAFIQTHLDIAGGSPDELLAIAKLISAWETAEIRNKVRNTQDATASLEEQPKLIQKHTWAQLKRSFNGNHYNLDETNTPSASYFELKLEQLEAGELTAEPLSNVTCEQDLEGYEAHQGLTIDPTNGSVRCRKVHNRKIEMPSSTEELRTRLLTLGHCYLLLQIKCPNMPCLQGLHPYDFDQHIKYITGETVLNMEVAAEQKGAIRPTLNLVMAYEFQVRKKAVKLVNDDGFTLHDALKTAREDAALHQRYLSTPLAVGAPLAMANGRGRSRSPLARREISNQNSAVNRKGRTAFATAWGQGKGKGSNFTQAWDKGKDSKGKGAFNRAKSNGLSTRTPDGKGICFAYNNPNERCRGPCPYAHVCMLCHGAHPAHMCPQRQQGPREATKASGKAEGKTGLDVAKLQLPQ